MLQPTPRTMRTSGTAGSTVEQAGGKGDRRSDMVVSSGGVRQVVSDDEFSFILLHRSNNTNSRPTPGLPRGIHSAHPTAAIVSLAHDLVVM